MFCNEIVSEIHKLFDDLVYERKRWGFLQQTKRVPLLSSPKDMGPGFSLWFQGSKIVDREKGSFEISSNTGFTSYRLPHLLSLSFALVSQDAGVDNKIRLLDRLHYFFFENRQMNPIIPQKLQEIKPLFERMQKIKAEIVDRSASKTSQLEEMDFYFPFEYLGPYHSGEFIRKGNLVTYKNLNMSRNTERRLS